MPLCCHGSRTCDLWTHSPVGLLSFFHQTSPSCRLISLRPSSVRLSRIAEQYAQGLRVLTSPQGTVFSGTPTRGSVYAWGEVMKGLRGLFSPILRPQRPRMPVVSLDALNTSGVHLRARLCLHFQAFVRAVPFFQNLL